MNVMDKWKLVRVSERFIVMALGLPVPPYVGHPLDLPLRSRFLSRDIKPHLKKLAPNAKPDLIERLAPVATVLGSMSFNDEGRIEIPEFLISADTSVLVLQNFPPHIKPRFLMDLLYPWPLLPTCSAEQRSIIEATYHRFGMLGFEIVKEPKTESSEPEKEIFQCMPGYNVTNIKLSESMNNNTLSNFPVHVMDLNYSEIESGKDHLVRVFAGDENLSTANFSLRLIITKIYLIQY